MASPSEKHREMIRKFLESEVEYNQILSETVQHFLLPLRLDSGTKILPRDVLPQVFLNIELLADTQKDILQSLRSAQTDPGAESPDGSIGDIEPARFWATLLHFVPKLQSYRQYLENFDTAQKLLNKYSSSKGFQKFLDQQKLWKPSLNLQKGLEAPTQHVRNYSLFVARCEKLIALDDPLLAEISEAGRQLAELNTALVEFRSNAEHVTKLRDIAKRIKGLDSKFVESGRKVIREGFLEKRNPKGKVQRRWFVLVSDMLLWAAPRGIGQQGMEVKGTLPLNVALVTESSPDSLGFQIVRMDLHKNYHITAESLEIKNRWLADLKALVDDLLEAGKQEAKSQTASTSGSSSPKPAKRGEVERVNSVNRLSRMPARNPGGRNSQKLEVPKEHPKLDLVDLSVPEEYRMRFQALVAEARSWSTKSSEIDSKLRSMDRRLRVVEISSNHG